MANTERAFAQKTVIRADLKPMIDIFVRIRAIAPTHVFGNGQTPIFEYSIHSFIHERWLGPAQVLKSCPIYSRPLVRAKVGWRPRRGTG